MTTLILSRLPGGKKRQCDSRCYNAIHKHCMCVCSGLNHGVGLTQAITNTAQHAKEIVDNENKGVQMPLVKTIVEP